MLKPPPGDRSLVVGRTAGPSCAPTDLNCDGRIDGGDIAVVVLNWGQCPCGSGCEGDIDQNGYVDAGDISLISLDWQG